MDIHQLATDLGDIIQELDNSRASTAKTGPISGAHADRLRERIEGAQRAAQALAHASPEIEPPSDLAAIHAAIPALSK